MNQVSITAIEYELGSRLVTNDDIAREMPDWNFPNIVKKTGIKSRRITAKDEKASDLGVRAAEKLFNSHDIARESVETLIYCTQSPDFPSPATACIIQDRLGLPTSTAAFDINQGCSGFVYGLAVASSMIGSGFSKKVLLICADTYSKYIRPESKSTRTLFGDAGSATLLEVSPDPSIGPFLLGTDGSGMEKIIVRNNCLMMDGPGVYLFTIRKVPECVHGLLKKAGKAMSDVDYFIFHQASKVVIDSIVKTLELDEGRVFRGYEEIGNTVSSTIPIALKQASEKKLIKKGDNIMLVGFGVGLSWGACFLKW